MSLARAWRRQLFGASSAALIVPSAMLAAVVVLALGGGFRQVGVLGQIFAGPPAPSVTGGAVPGSSSMAHALPAIPVAAVAPRRAGFGGGTRAVGGRRGMVPVSSHGPSQTGGALGGGGTVPIVTARPPAPSSPPLRPAPTGSVPSQPSAPPPPKPQPTPVDRIVNTVTPITQQAPAPAGPALTQAVESAGSAADSLLPKLR